MVRLENWPCWRAYIAKKKVMAEAGNDKIPHPGHGEAGTRWNAVFESVSLNSMANETFLLHSTTADEALRIAQAGFDVSRQTYSKGIYFTDSSCRSLQSLHVRGGEDGGGGGGGGGGGEGAGEGRVADTVVVVVCRVLLGYAFHTRKALGKHKQAPEDEKRG